MDGVLPWCIFVGRNALVNRSLYREIVRIELTPMGVERSRYGKSESLIKLLFRKS